MLVASEDPAANAWLTDSARTPPLTIFNETHAAVRANWL